MANKLNLSRQTKIVPYDKINEYTFKVFGVGSIGSKFVRELAKSGAINIEVFDMDIVEEENIAAQAYDFEHIGKNKVDALAEIVKKGSGIDLITVHGTVTKETKITPEANTIYCCFFDSFEGRQLIFDKIKTFPTIFIDGRIGGYNKRHYLVDCSIKEDVKEYDKTLKTTAESELACGEKANAAINSIIAGEIIMNLITFILKKDYIQTHIGSVMAPNSNINVLKLITATE